MQSESTTAEIQVWFEIYLPFAVSLLMLLAMIIRFCQLTKSAKHALQKMNWVIKTRVFLILFVIGCLIGLAFLSLYDFGYQFYKHNDGVVFAFESTIMTAQIGSLVYEYTKNVPIMWPHKAYWLIQTILDIVTFSNAIVGHTQESSDGVTITTPEMIFVSLHVLSLVLLTGFTFLYRKQDIFEYESGSFFALTPNTEKDEKKVALIQQNYSAIINQQESKNLLRVVVCKDFLTQKDEFGQEEVILKLRVFNADKSIQQKLTKKLQDFIDLETALLQEAKYLPQNVIYPFKIPDDQHRTSISGILDVVYNNSGIGIVQSRTMGSNVNYLQLYMSTLTSKVEYYLPPLLDFLNIPFENRYIIERERNKSYVISQNEHGDPLGESSNSIIQEDSNNTSLFANKSRVGKSVIKGLIPLDEQPEEEKENHSELLSQNEEELNYFEAQIVRESQKEKHREYEIAIKDLKNYRKWTITKRFRDFKALNEQLKQTLNLQKMPPLPKKNFKFLLDEKELMLRKQGLEGYLKIILNEKMYFIQPLFEFINLKPNDVNNFMSLVPSEFERIAEFQTISIGPSEIIDGKEQYTVYRYKILIPYTTRNKENIIIDSNKLIQKRYTDFSTLHEGLIVHFQGTNIQLPELPPKFSHFGNHTTIAYRDIGFQNYLNALFKVPQILDCVLFRLFIQWQQFNQIPQQSESSQLQSIQLPNQGNFQRTTSECLNSLVQRDLQQAYQIEELENQYSGKSPEQTVQYQL